METFVQLLPKRGRNFPRGNAKKMKSAAQLPSCSLVHSFLQIWFGSKDEVAERAIQLAIAGKFMPFNPSLLWSLRMRTALFL